MAQNWSPITENENILLVKNAKKSTFCKYHVQKKEMIAWAQRFHEQKRNEYWLNGLMGSKK